MARAEGPHLQYRRQKTQKSSGILVSILIHPDLWAVIGELPKDRPFLATAYGKGRSAAGLGNKMHEWCDLARLPECSAHGLRKVCARRLAEAGATAHEIMSITGHKTLAEVQRYTEAALREGLADSAMEKLLSRPNREQTVVNLRAKFAINSNNHMKGK
ncbi:MAG: tyrosine-type recombinase/integrase [Gemmobacter sp.]|jgi:integrase|nr:tyrosine-type recombinase/integrase [Gemmobacter sp.]